MIKNLVFKGGGVLGIAYAGVLKELEEKGVLQNIERVAGTSAGAITACLVALKYTAAEIAKIVNETDFASFEDDCNPIRIVTKYGLYSGDNFLKWIRTCIENKGLRENATFEDLKDFGFLDLHIFSTDLNEKWLQRFSFGETPKAIVAEAVRASMSIPFFFKAWKFSNSEPDDHVYVDGGAIYNYPLTAFDNGECNKETLGFFLSNIQDKRVISDLGYDHPGRYIKALAETVLDSQNIDLANDVSEMDRTILIDNLGISAVNFHITDDQKKALFDSGAEAIRKSTKLQDR